MSCPTARSTSATPTASRSRTIEGAGLPSPARQGAPLSGGHWRPIRAGEFILGYPDEENVLPDAPTPDQLATNGSFLVYRKLHQDVAAFRAQLAQAAQLYPGGEELLAAKIVGRWRDGTPIDLSPEHPDPAIVADGDRNNAFSYGTDGDGLRCPVGAHVRRANPRDSLPFEGKLVNRHRLIRRGIPYGDPLPEGADDDGQDRGVIFMCLQASIARQFEFIQGQWLNGGNAFTLGEDQDVLRRGTGRGRAAQDDGPGQPAVLRRTVAAGGHGQGRRVLLRAGHQRPAVPGLGGGERSGMSILDQLVGLPDVSPYLSMLLTKDMGSRIAEPVGAIESGRGRVKSCCPTLSALDLSI